MKTQYCKYVKFIYILAIPIKIFIGFFSEVSKQIINSYGYVKCQKRQSNLLVEEKTQGYYSSKCNSTISYKAILNTLCSDERIKEKPIWIGYRFWEYNKTYDVS